MNPLMILLDRNTFIPKVTKASEITGDQEFPTTMTIVLTEDLHVPETGTLVQKKVVMATIETIETQVET